MAKPITPIYLPILCKDNVDPKSAWARLNSTNAKYFWPGLPDKPLDYWQVSDYPFNSDQAQACLNDLINMGDAALSGVPMHALMGVQDQRLKLKDFEEQESLSHFVNTGQASQNTRSYALHVEEAAQKFLIWAWLLEDRFHDIQSLTQKYANGAKYLIDSLQAEQDEGLSTIQNIETFMQGDETFLPPWTMVVENASIFLENDCTIIVNHKLMVSHILETCSDVIPLSEETKQLLELQGQDFIGHECRLSIGNILNKPERKKQSNPWLNKVLHLVLLENK